MSSRIGPIVFDLIGTELSEEEREMLQHPLIGGVIFFARNYESPEQIAELCKNIRQSRKLPILITVDQEGGRVQRFRTGFTRLPGMCEIGKLFLDSRETALELANVCGWIMAAELLAAGVDLSFAPVLDMEKGINPAIAGRAFDRESANIITLATTFTQGMREAGMVAVGKHFPGHGSVTVDSHLDLPIDTRSLHDIAADDMVTFIEMIRGGIEGIMASHILFPAVDSMPVGFSHRWLKEILRKQLQFHGMIFSDDLSMKGAIIAGDYPERARAALEAGCDMALICNHRESVIKTLDGLPNHYHLLDSALFKRMQGNFSQQVKNLKDTPIWGKKYNYFMRLVSEHAIELQGN
ncbi:MAG: beta-N-acetylhexosaminidase [Gammaproteobacteria bacterium]|nr:beta-N-acetylhexosaminidase [Gammaproteobacteria bacterium]